MEIKVKPLSEEDLDEVCRIEEQCFSMPWKKEDFKNLIKDSGSEYFVVLADSHVVGCGGYTDQVGEGYINNIAVSSEYRGKGLGSLLLETILDAGRRKGITDFTLEVRVGNAPAVKMYEKLGFESAGIRKRFYEKPVEDAYVMWLRGYKTEVGDA